MADRIVISRLGSRGEGLADTPTGVVAITGALPGEVVVTNRDAGGAGPLVQLEQLSPDRVTPPCGLFGTCGGCALQHLAHAPYRAWKRGLVTDALARAQITAEVEPLVDAHGDGRRRVVFHARGQGQRVSVGFMAARTHDLVSVPACFVLSPSLADAPAVGQQLAAALDSAKPLDIQVTATEVGLDVDIRGHGPPAAEQTERLAAVAEARDLARVSMHGYPVAERRAPTVTMGQARVALPAGGFLQATQAGEDTLAALVAGALPQRGRIVDLFSGVGPFALRLAARQPVEAFELDNSAVAAMGRAARMASRLKPLTVSIRDLFRQPLMPAELDDVAGVVLDPPRAGAREQCMALARADVTHVAMVSCNVSTFARDAAILIAGGYTLTRVVPVDQFLYTAHVELVGVFEKPRRTTRRRLLG